MNRMLRITATLGLLMLTPCLFAAVKRAPTVSPVDELEILDPKVDDEGKPRALPIPEEGAVIIPPTLIVHRYYYTGDRSFQGPMLAGGPCILIVHHPRTGEQINVPVQMLPGAPRICYKRNAIEYDFGCEMVKVHFGREGLLGRIPVPTVSYHRSPSNAPRTARVKAPGPIAQSLKSTGQAVLAPVVNTINVLPLGAPTTSAIEDISNTRQNAKFGTNITEGLEGTVPALP